MYSTSRSPKDLHLITISKQDRLGALTDPVVAQHASLAGLPLVSTTTKEFISKFPQKLIYIFVAGIAQQLAEIYYIVGAQQLEGYGQV